MTTDSVTTLHPVYLNKSINPQFNRDLLRTNTPHCSLLGTGKVGPDFIQLNFVVEGHQVDTVLGGVLDVRRLLARIGVDDSRRRNFQIQNFLYLTLRNTQTVLIAAQSADIYDLHIQTSCCSTHTNTICLTARCPELPE